jgi:hypothetical protein
MVRVVIGSVKVYFWAKVMISVSSMKGVAMGSYSFAGVAARTVLSRRRRTARRLII